MGEVDPRGGQRRRVRQVRRGEPDDALARPGQCRERRQHQLELADAFAPAEDLGERPGRPSAAGQLVIQVGETGGERRHGRERRAAAPDRVAAQNFLQRQGDIAHKSRSEWAECSYCMYIQ